MVCLRWNSYIRYVCTCPSFLYPNSLLEVDDEKKKIQKGQFSNGKIFQRSSNLNDRARLLASSQPEPSIQLQLGLFVDNNTMWNAMHVVVVKKSLNKIDITVLESLPRHATIKKIIFYGLRTADFPKKSKLSRRVKFYFWPRRFLKLFKTIVNDDTTMAL